MLNAEKLGGRYHVKAKMITGGPEPVDIWIADGVFSLVPVEGAVEVEGAFAALGMVDGHVHLTIDFANTGLPAGTEELVLQNAQRHLCSGVTALRDAGYVQQLGIDAVALPPIPLIQRSGWMVVPEGRFFPGTDVGKSTSPDDLIGRVEEVAAQGVPWFKLIADFPGPDMDLFSAPLTYPIENVREAVKKAHALGLRVMAHSTGPDVGQLIAAGVDAIEHGMGVTTADVRAMSERGVHWTPTIATVETFLLQAEKKGAPSEPRLAWGARLQECLRLAMALRVPVLAGSDELPHGSLARELDAMVRHGMTVAEVLNAASIEGRSALGLGLLEQGASADLVVWDEDPRLDLGLLNRPRAVLAAGRLVDLDLPLAPAGVVPAVRDRLAHSHDDCLFAR